VIKTPNFFILRRTSFDRLHFLLLNLAQRFYLQFGRGRVASVGFKETLCFLGNVYGLLALAGCLGVEVKDFLDLFVVLFLPPLY
jgi:hypothetical protein